MTTCKLKTAGLYCNSLNQVKNWFSYTSAGDFRKTIPESSTAMDKSGDVNKQAGTTLKELYLCKNDENPAVYECEIMLFTQQMCERNGTDCSTTDDMIQCCITDFTSLRESVHNYSPLLTDFNIIHENIIWEH